MYTYVFNQHVFLHIKSCARFLNFTRVEFQKPNNIVFFYLVRRFSTSIKRRNKKKKMRF